MQFKTLGRHKICSPFGINKPTVEAELNFHLTFHPPKRFAGRRVANLKHARLLLSERRKHYLEAFFNILHQLRNKKKIQYITVIKVVNFEIMFFGELAS